uniref:Uncharacterized protein n=1 Tax=Anguilla anguilla TaxID=7936 RepID=A0A0E9R4B2_ANGAN
MSLAKVEVGALLCPFIDTTKRVNLHFHEYIYRVALSLIMCLTA